MAQLLLRGTALAAPPIRAVLFDKDGTLSHSEPKLLALARARIQHCRRLLAERHPELAAPASGLGTRLEATYGLRGQAIHPAGSMAVASREHNLIATATALAQEGLGWPEAIDLAAAVFDLCDAARSAAGPPPCPATPGLERLLKELQGAQVACAVISNDERQGIEAFLAGTDLRGRFAVLRSAEQRPAKPDPAAVSALCAELGVEPGACALIGDANSDLLMAERAGVAVVLGYSAGWRQPPPLASHYRQLAHWRELEVRSA